ncbi:MAG: YIP1 family protein [Gemmatimonadota bacterium]
MTEPAPEQAVSGWEDYLEIFYAPSRVFARRGTRWGMPLLVLVIVSGVLILGTMGLLTPLLESDSQRVMASKLQQMTPEQADRVRQMSGKIGMFFPIFAIATMAILPIIVGLLLWFAGKVVGAVQELGAAFMVAVFAMFPRILSWAILGMQAAILPEENLKGLASVTLSPARFMDPANTSMGLIALGMRFDVFVIWSTILLAIGLKVTGKVSGQKAAIAAILVWVAGSLQALVQLIRG